MNDHTIAAAGNAPRGCEPGEGTREVHAPSQPAAARTLAELNPPVDLNLDQAAALSLHIEKLAEFCAGVGITPYITLHKVTRLAAWEAFPSGEEGILRDGPRAMGTRTVDICGGQLVVFTGEIS